MAKCDVCGNDYDKSFQIISAGKTRTFDSFECAIHMLAPTCPHCDCKVIGHGVEAGGQIYCCVHCAEESGAHGLKDRGHFFRNRQATRLPYKTLSSQVDLKVARRYPSIRQLPNSG